MGRLAAPLALAILVAACGGPINVVPNLLTGDPLGGPGGACYTSGAGGLLVADRQYGTAIIRDAGPWGDPSPSSVVAWPPGFTGRRVGSEVEVLDAQGTLVATTGHRYYLEGGGVDPRARPHWPVAVFWACGEILESRE